MMNESGVSGQRNAFYGQTYLRYSSNNTNGIFRDSFQYKGLNIRDSIQQAVADESVKVWIAVLWGHLALNLQTAHSYLFSFSLK